MQRPACALEIHADLVDAPVDRNVERAQRARPDRAISRESVAFLERLHRSFEFGPVEVRIGDHAFLDALADLNRRCGVGG